MGLSLTRKDVFALLNDKSSVSRLALAKKIGVGYNTKLYAQDEIEIAEEILRLLVKDAEIIVRTTLSKALKLSDDLPHDIALTLARDVEEVALPILEFSNVLNDIDFLDIIYDAPVQKLLAISRRKKLTSAVAKGLIDKDIKEVSQSVFENAEFTNNNKEYEKFIEICSGDEIVIRQMVSSLNISTSVVEKMLAEVSGQILHEIKAKYNIVPYKLDKYISHSLEISTLSIIDHNSSNEEIGYLVDHLYTFGRLTPSLILSAACMGKRRFLIAGLAKLAGIPKANARVLTERGGEQGFHALLSKAGLPEKLFDVMDLIMKLTHEKKTKEPNISVKEFCNWLIDRLENVSDKKNIEYISYMVALAKQGRQMKVMEIY